MNSGYRRFSLHMLSTALLLTSSLVFSACGPQVRSDAPKDTSAAASHTDKEARVIKTAHEYRHGDATLDGYFVLPADASASDKRPGVLVVHAWMGIDDHVEEVSKKLAAQGFVAFVCDIYGKGIRPTTPQEASAQASIYRSDRQLQRTRVQAGLDQLKAHSAVDASRIVAIGYCFGGGTVLELARSGADLKAVVSFHGNLDTPKPETTRNLKAAVFAMHGADDPYVPAESVTAFETEMREAKADWVLTKFGNAVHSFTDRAANSDGARYNADADTRSWSMLGDILTRFTGRGF